MATPWAASSDIRAWISDFAPTSIPCVGSSRTRTDGRVTSQRLRATFCWFPPESVATGRKRAGVLMARRRAYSTAISFSRRESSLPRRESRSSDASVMLALIGSSATTPCRRRSSGRWAMPCAMASAGRRMRTVRPRSRISPWSAGVRPKIARATSVRPAPTRPARPRTSPARRERLTSRTPVAEQPRPRSSSTTSPGAAGFLGNTASRRRPTMSWISSARSTSAIGRVAMVRPSRRTVTRSATRASSSSRCEM